MEAPKQESGFAVLAIAIIAALVLGLALAGSGACW
jgi:hypothetical protein